MDMILSTSNGHSNLQGAMGNPTGSRWGEKFMLRCNAKTANRKEKTKNGLLF